MTTIFKENLHYEVYDINRFHDFLSSHDLVLDNSIDIDKIDIFYLKKIMFMSGWNIEATEISTADNSVNAKNNWKRTNTWRWDIVYWDKDDYMACHKLSDVAKGKVYESEERAILSAANYILENFESLER